MLKSLNSLFVVIVLYKTNLADCISFTTLQHCLAAAEMPDIHVMLYDNSPQAQSINQSLYPNNIHLHYKSDTSNGGISKAYNYGAAYAKNMQGVKWLLFLDQDTNLPENLLLQYQKSMLSQPDVKLFVPILKLNNGTIFSPCRYVFKRGFPLKNIEPGSYDFTKYSPVNSGMLVELNAFFEAGGYKNEVRLDFSDFQFIERFRKKNELFCVINATCLQDFSNEETSIDKLNLRYKMFCESARNTDKNNWLDECMYFGVVLMRATTLSIRTKKTIFYKTFLQQYLKS